VRDGARKERIAEALRQKKRREFQLEFGKMNKDDKDLMAAKYKLAEA